MTNVLNIISTSNDKCPKHRQHQQWHMSWTSSTPAMTYVLNIMNTSNDTHMYALNIIHTSNNTCEHHQHQPWYMSQTLSEHYWFAYKVHTVWNKLLHNIRMFLLSTVKTDQLTELSYEQNTLESFCNQGVETVMLTQLLHQTTECRHHLLCPGRQQSAGTTYWLRPTDTQAPLTDCVQANTQAPLTDCVQANTQAPLTDCVQADMHAPFTDCIQADTTTYWLHPGRHACTIYWLHPGRYNNLLTASRQIQLTDCIQADTTTYWLHPDRYNNLLTASRQIQQLTDCIQADTTTYWLHPDRYNNLLTVSRTPSPSKSGPSRQMVTSWKWRQKSRKDIQNSPSSRDSTWIFLLVASSTHCQFTSLTQDGNLHISHLHEYSCSWSCSGTADDRCHKNCDQMLLKTGGLWWGSLVIVCACVCVCVHTCVCVCVCECRMLYIVLVFKQLASSVFYWMFYCKMYWIFHVNDEIEDEFLYTETMTFLLYCIQTCTCSPLQLSPTCHSNHHSFVTPTVTPSLTCHSKCHPFVTPTINHLTLQPSFICHSNCH